jgi:RecJ-like exonuclease
MNAAEMGTCPKCKGARAILENMLVPCDFVDTATKAACKGGHYSMESMVVKQTGLFVDKMKE